MFKVRALALRDAWQDYWGAFFEDAFATMNKGDDDYQSQWLWAALTPYSARAVYAGVAEVSVYVAEAMRGQGVGRRLLTALVDASEAAGQTVPALAKKHGLGLFDPQDADNGVMWMGNPTSVAKVQKSWWARLFGR